MSLARPNRSASPAGARWVLKKYMNWPAEFGRMGSVNFKTVGSPWTDSEGHDWTIVTPASAVLFDLRSTGVYVSMASAASSALRVVTRDLIPGLDPMDKLWIMWKLVSFNGFANTGAFADVAWKRNTTNDGGARWEQKTPTGVEQLAVAVWSDGSLYSYALPEAGANRLLSINGSGMTFQMREQLASVDFPATPDPSEIPLYGSASQDGNLGANIDGTGSNPNVKDVDLSEDNLRCGLFASGVGAHNVTWEEFWVYRYE